MFFKFKIIQLLISHKVTTRPISILDTTDEIQEETKNSSKLSHSIQNGENVVDNGQTSINESQCGC